MNYLKEIKIDEEIKLKSKIIYLTKMIGIHLTMKGVNLIHDLILEINRGRLDEPILVILQVNHQISIKEIKQSMKLIWRFKFYEEPTIGEEIDFKQIHEAINEDFNPVAATKITDLVNN